MSRSPIKIFKNASLPLLERYEAAYQVAHDERCSKSTRQEALRFCLQVCAAAIYQPAQTEAEPSALPYDGYAETIAACPEWVQDSYHLHYMGTPDAYSQMFEAGRAAIEWHCSEAGQDWRFCQKDPQRGDPVWQFQQSGFPKQS